MSRKHGKCSVRVTSSAGEAFTTKRGANRLVDSGLARFIDERTIEMSETDHRFLCETGGNNGPALPVTIEPRARHTPQYCEPHGFLRYPQPGAFRKRKPLSCFNPLGELFDQAA